MAWLYYHRKASYMGSDNMKNVLLAIAIPKD